MCLGRVRRVQSHSTLRVCLPDRCYPERLEDPYPKPLKLRLVQCTAIYLLALAAALLSQPHVIAVALLYLIAFTLYLIADAYFLFIWRKVMEDVSTLLNVSYHLPKLEKRQSIQ